MFGLGWTEVAVILLVAVLIFGPKKIPELGGSFGKTLRNFKEGLSQPEEEALDDEKDDRA